MICEEPECCGEVEDRHSVGRRGGKRVSARNVRELLGGALFLGDDACQLSHGLRVHVMLWSVEAGKRTNVPHG